METIDAEKLEQLLEIKTSLETKLIEAFNIDKNGDKIENGDKSER